MRSLFVYTQTMSARIELAFKRAREDGRTALMPYITAGDPPVPALDDLIVAIAESGADIIEIGVPFSDPIADGPVIASAMFRALEQGMTPAEVLAQVARARSRTDVALVAMVSDSIVAHRGRTTFVSEAANAGLDGLIVPDADTADLEDLESACSEHGLALILLVAPTSSDARQAELVSHASGFIYLLARAGVTGERSEAPDISGRVAALRAHTSLPIGVGFGIATAEHVEAVGNSADGAIVGSALVRHLHEAHQTGEDVLKAARTFVSGLRRT